MVWSDDRAACLRPSSLPPLGFAIRDSKLYMVPSRVTFYLRVSKANRILIHASKKAPNNPQIYAYFWETTDFFNPLFQSRRDRSDLTSPAEPARSCAALLSALAINPAPLFSPSREAKLEHRSHRTSVSDHGSHDGMTQMTGSKAKCGCFIALYAEFSAPTPWMVKGCSLVLAAAWFI